MGVRTRSATPGTLLCLAATALLAVVSFNTPLLKSLYFLEANFSEGSYSGTLTLGTLGYCLNNNCVGPQVGYEFNPNTLFDISVFDIPTAITKYLTYTLILHIVALAAAGLATIFGALSHISSLSVMCFPTCFASIASSVSLLALIFDLVIFYIAKARIDAVQGASASIGVSVWLVLAAWLVSGIGGCAYGIGRCCVNNRGKRSSGDPKTNYYAGQSQPDDMRMQALRDEQLRKKEQGLPNFQELERTPLRDDSEDKYLYEETPTLRRDGSMVQGVGVGYGRRNQGGQAGQGGYGGYGQNGLQAPPGVARRESFTSSYGPGAAGVGAGGQGVERANDGYNGYYGNAQNNYYDGNYNDPGYNDQGYNDQGYSDPYQQQHQHQPQYGYNNQYNDQHSYPPVATTGAVPVNNNRRPSDAYDPYAAGNTSIESHYSSTGPPVTHAPDPYGGYDDGLGAIGRAATIPPEQSHQRDYTGGSYGYHNPSDNNAYNAYNDPQPGYGANGQPASGSRGQAPIHVPTPQHLTSHNSAQDLLRSPLSPGPQNDHNPYRVTSPHDAQAHAYHAQQQDDDDVGYNRPPSYGSVAGALVGSSTQYPNEKSQYR